ncbi:DUF4870 domain-containing protein [Solibacillus sp. FSL H8-0538]|uniref:DUF4870 domain-containing protein n=1 Tax=Solibacillus sp. FSL H8-0538 TaxID=2921400 RepID=UPI0030FCD849
MDNTKGLSALNYFSIFFAPFLLPIIVFLISQDEEVRYHAKRALLSHVIPFVIGIIIAAFFLFTVILSGNEPNWGDTVFTSMFLLMGLYALASFFIVIWNVIQGVKVLR